MHNSRGFTLIELVVVIAMIAIVLAIAAPSMQNLVNRHAEEELISELQLARMMAIRLHRPVTATFQFNTTQCRVSWTDDAGAPATKVVDLGQQGDRFRFDNNPPGAGTPAPDNAFIFSPLGFISTNPGGNVGGNTYLSNRNNTRQFQVTTTIAGGIDLNRYDPGSGQWRRVH